MKVKQVRQHSETFSTVENLKAGVGRQVSLLVIRRGGLEAGNQPGES